METCLFQFWPPEPGASSIADRGDKSALEKIEELENSMELIFRLILISETMDKRH